MTSAIEKYRLLGRNIQRARKNKHLSQNELAERLCISREHLAKIETAKRGISLDLLFKVCDELEVSEQALFNFNNQYV